MTTDDTRTPAHVPAPLTLEGRFTAWIDNDGRTSLEIDNVVLDDMLRDWLATAGTDTDTWANTVTVRITAQVVSVTPIDYRAERRALRNARRVYYNTAHVWPPSYWTLKQIIEGLLVMGVAYGHDSDSSKEDDDGTA